MGRREDVLDRVARWLTPEGMLVLVDCVSFPIFSSSNRTYRAAMEAWIEALAITGTDYEWARTFPDPLRRHAYRELGATTLVPMLRGGSPMARFWSLTLETIRNRIVDAGLLSSIAVDNAQALLADPDFWDLGPGFVAAWGRRPT